MVEKPEKNTFDELNNALNELKNQSSGGRKTRRSRNKRRRTKKRVLKMKK